VYLALPVRIEVSSCAIAPERVIRTVDRSLTAQLFQHLRSTGQSISRLSDRDVEDEFLDAELPHGVGGLVFSHCDCAESCRGVCREEVRDREVLGNHRGLTRLTLNSALAPFRAKRDMGKKFGASSNSIQVILQLLASADELTEVQNFKSQFLNPQEKPSQRASRIIMANKQGKMVSLDPPPQLQKLHVDIVS